MIVLLLILCTHNGAETLRATILPGSQMWRGHFPGGLDNQVPTGLWATATRLADPAATDVLLVTTEQPNHGSAAFIVNAAECVVTP